MRLFLALVLSVLVVAAAFGGWRIQELSERLDAVQAERDEVTDALDDLEQRAELLSASHSQLQAETEETAATIADLHDAVTGGGGPEQGGVFETFRGPVSIEDLYFELVDDEFEGIPNSRIDRLERCVGSQAGPDDVCGPLPAFGD